MCNDMNGTKLVLAMEKFQGNVRAFVGHQAEEEVVSRPHKNVLKVMRTLVDRKKYLEGQSERF